MPSYFRLMPTSLFLPTSGRRFGLGRKQNRPPRPSATDEQRRAAAGRVRAGDQRLGDRRRAIALGVADIGREAGDRRHADRDLRRKPVAARSTPSANSARSGRSGQRRPLRARSSSCSSICTKPPDTVRSPPGVVMFELPRLSNVATWSLERIDAEGHRVAPVADIEARGVVDVAADRIEHDSRACRRRSRRCCCRAIAERADAAAGGDAVVVGLGLVVLGAVAVELRVPVEQVVVRLAVAPVDRARVVLHGRMRRPTSRRSPPAAPPSWSARDSAGRCCSRYSCTTPPNLIWCPSHGRVVSLNRPAGDLGVGIADLGAVAVLVVRIAAIDRAAEQVDVGIEANAAERRAQAARLVRAADAGRCRRPSARRDARRPRCPWCGTTPRRRSRRSRRCWRSGRARCRCRRSAPDRGRTSRWRCGRCADSSAARRRPRPRRGRNPAGREC